MNYAHAEVREHQTGLRSRTARTLRPRRAGTRLDAVRLSPDSGTRAGGRRDPDRVRPRGPRVGQRVVPDSAATHPARRPCPGPSRGRGGAGHGCAAVGRPRGSWSWWFPARSGLRPTSTSPSNSGASDWDGAADRVTVAPGIEHNARPWPGGEAVANDLASLRGFAASAYHRGADSLYLFNWMDSETRPVTRRRVLAAVA